MWSAVSKFHKIQSSYVHEICLNILLFAALDVCSFGTILFVVPSRSVSDIKDNVNAKWNPKEHGEGGKKDSQSAEDLVSLRERIVNLI